MFRLDEGEVNKISNNDTICVYESRLTTPLSNPPRTCFQYYHVFYINAVKEKSLGRASGGVLILVTKKITDYNNITIVVLEGNFWVFLRIKINLYF